MEVQLASDACVMPVADGRPTGADVDQAFRMVGGATALPGEDRLWMYGTNRGGEWTIDSQGRYVRFPSPEVRQLFNLNHVREGRSGRIIAASKGTLFRYDRRSGGFSPMTQVAGPEHYTELLRVERLNLTLVIRADQVLELVGDRTRIWKEAPNIVGTGETQIQAFDLPSLQGVLFASPQGFLKFRSDDGIWLNVADLRRDKRYDYIEDVQQTARGGLVLVALKPKIGGRGRLLALSRRDGVLYTQAAGLEDDTPDSSGGQILYASASGEVLRYEQPRPGSLPRWSRLTNRGYETIAEDFPARRQGDILFLNLQPLTTRGETAVIAEAGIVLYRAGRMRLIPSPPEGLGAHPRVIDLKAIDWTLISSTHGLFRLTSDDKIVRLAAPFETGGLPPLIVFDDLDGRRAVILASKGLYTLDRRGVFRRVPGAGPTKLSFADRRVATMAASGDDLLLAENRLWLLVSPRSPRWAACRALLRSGAKATSTATQNTAAPFTDGSG